MSGDVNLRDYAALVATPVTAEEVRSGHGQVLGRVFPPRDAEAEARMRAKRAELQEMLTRKAG